MMMNMGGSPGACESKMDTAAMGSELNENANN